MYPEDRVWRNIQQSLHGKDRWPALTFAAFLTGAFITVLLFLTHPDKGLFNVPATFTSTNTINEENTVDPIIGAVPITDITLQSGIFITENKKQKSDRSGYSANQKNAESDLNSSIAISLEGTDPQSAETGSISFGNTYNENIESVSSIPILRSQNNFQPVPFNSISTDDIISSPLSASVNALSKKTSTTGFENTLDQTGQKALNHSSDEEKRASLAKTKKAKSGRLALQFYATPSVSYRYLIDDKRQVHDPGTGPYALFATQEVNAFVRQKPKLGLEAGAAILYSLSDNFRLKTGLQLNYRQFSIIAYNTNTEPARLELDNGYGIRSVVQLTNISNQSGYREIELNNHFLQLAIPVGFDLKIAEVNKVSFYVAAAGQLTYQLKSNNYLISADFKNFVKNSDLDRKVNFNTAVEAFATFKTGNVTWQAGPQIRYQLLPGSKNAYPIREHLIDYGMKVGIIQTLK